MRIVQIQFIFWDKIYNFSPNDLDLKKGDKVIVKTELGVEIGQVIGFLEINEEEYNKNYYSPESITDVKIKDSHDNKQNHKDGDNKEKMILKPITRKATPSDLKKIPSLSDKKMAMDYCQKMKDKQGLPMKIIDVHFSFDGSRLTFAFIADGRIDFRELVKNLTRHFGRTIRLQQIGIRDEAKLMGDCGHCGRSLCCGGFLNKFSSITSEMAELQQISHRGSERISGICGRLMCCLAYEKNGYEKLAEKIPAIGTKVNVDGKKGVIVGHHILKQSVDVKFPPENGEKNSTVVDVDLNRNKTKK